MHPLPHARPQRASSHTRSLPSLLPSFGPTAPSTVGVSSCASQIPFPKTVTAARIFILALFACCSSHCTSRPHTTSYPSSGTLLPTWYALPAKQPCYPNPPPLSHLPKLSLPPLKPVPSLLSRKLPAAESLPSQQPSAPTAGPLCVVNVAKCRPAFFSLPFPSYKLYPTFLSFSRPCPSPTICCSTSSLHPSRPANHSDPHPHYYTLPALPAPITTTAAPSRGLLFYLSFFAQSALLTGCSS